MTRRVLITGASGFVGGHVVNAALDSGYSVRALVRDRDRAQALEARGVELALGDLRDQASLNAAAKDCIGVLHIAALFRETNFPEAVFNDINLEGTRRLLDAAIAAGASRFVHCSTSGVLGELKEVPASEETPYNPSDMYQRSKTAGEQLALEYFRSNKISGVVIRPAMIYGPGDTRLFKIFRLISKQRFFYVGKGDAFVHFIDVRDLARAFILALEARQHSGEIYTIAGERAMTLKQAADFIADELGVARPWLHLPKRTTQLLGTVCEAVCAPFGISPPIYRRRVDFYTKHRCFRTEKAARDLGFKPARAFVDEVRDIIAWYRDHDMLPRPSRRAATTPSNKQTSVVIPPT